MQQIVEAEPAGNNEHEAFIELGRNVKKDLVIIVQLQLVVFDVEYHPGLLLVEEFPHFKHVLEVLPGDFVEMALERAKLLLILFFEDLEVKIKETLNFGCVVGT